MAFSSVETSGHGYSSVLQNVAMVLKVLLLSLGLISSVAMLRGAFLPFSCELVFSNVVGFWNSLKCFLSSPLYICIIINLMVLLIATLSTFPPHEPPPPPPPLQPPRLDVSEPPQPQPQPQPQELLSRTEKFISTPSFDHDIHVHNHEDYFPEFIMKSDQLSSDEQLDEGGKEQEEEEDTITMEATWKAITGGNKGKHLTKSETFIQTGSVQHSKESPATSTCTWKDLKKSETFNEAVSLRRRGGMRRDPSVGIDEFNQQVEAFIKKFNDDMRLQRQESDQRFIDMINRGL